MEADAFAGLGNLNTLVLYANNITRLVPRTFASLGALQLLLLNANELRCVLRTRASERSRPRGNRTPILGETFFGLRSLNLLSLYDNQIVSLPNGTFDHLGALSTLHLARNPLHCDCQIVSAATAAVCRPHVAIIRRGSPSFFRDGRSKRAALSAPRLDASQSADFRSSRRTCCAAKVRSAAIVCANLSVATCRRRCRRAPTCAAMRRPRRRRRRVGRHVSVDLQLRDDRRRLHKSRPRANSATVAVANSRAFARTKSNHRSRRASRAAAKPATTVSGVLAARQHSRASFFFQRSQS